LMMSLWDALRMNMMISYQELVRTFLRAIQVMKKKMQPQLQMPGSPIGCNSFFCPKKTLKTLVLATA
ncbi:hypothetical protein, partial [Citrobacter braakii]|uniref:hypothetical protein n=1 Tax=Citrobacter braakii TaxID=57706 RepID=UPI0032C1359A